MTVVLSLFLFCTGCSNKDKKPTGKEPTILIKKDTPQSKTGDKPKSAPIINITDTIAIRYHVLYIKDSAATSIRLSQKLAAIYGEKLGSVIRKNKLKPVGPPMAWYKTQKAPFFFEAGIPIEKKPGKLPKQILYKQLKGDSAVVAHFYGPYEETYQAYYALKEWLKDRKRKSTAPPYEIYISDPIDEKGKPKDPYKVQTDIIFPHN